MKAQSIAVLITFISFFSSLGCGKKDSDSSDDDKNKSEEKEDQIPPPIIETEVLEEANLDFDKIDSIALAKANVERDSSFSLSGSDLEGRTVAQNKLFVESEGAFKVLDFDKNGSLSYQRIFVTPKFLYLVLQVGYAQSETEQCYVLAVSRKSKRITCIPNIYFGPEGVAGLEPGVDPIQTNEDGDLAYIVGFYSGEDKPEENQGVNTMLQVDLTTETMMVKIIYAKDHYIEDMAVSNEGDVILKSSPTSSRENFIIYRDASIQKLENEANSVVITKGIGENINDFYFVAYDGIKLLKKLDGQYKAEDYFGDEGSDFNLSNMLFQFSNESAIYSTLIRSNSPDDPVNYIIEFAKNNSTPKKIVNTADTRVEHYRQISGNESILTLAAFDKFNNTALIKYDIEDETFTTVIDYDSYKFRDVSMDSKGQISFAAERLSDSAFVAGFVTVDNKVEIRDISASRIYQMIRIK